jgi:hypothetical protein
MLRNTVVVQCDVCFMLLHACLAADSKETLDSNYSGLSLEGSRKSIQAEVAFRRSKIVIRNASLEKKKKKVVYSLAAR